MGKTKSVVLMTLLTIVIVALCAMAAVPSFSLSVFDKESVKRWNPVVAQFDLDEDLGGGYYVRFYPEGVVSDVEYLSTQTEEEKNNPTYTKFGGMYLSTDSDLDIVDEVNGTYQLSENFKAAFDKTVALLKTRFESMNYSTFRVSVLDGCAVEVEIPASSANATTALTYFSYTGALVMTDGTNTYGDEKTPLNAYIEEFASKSTYGNPYIEITVTDEGEAAMKTLTENGGTISFNAGDDTVLSLSATYLSEQDDNVWVVGMNNAEATDLFVTALNTALETGDTGLSFASEKTEIGTYEPVYGNGAFKMLVIAMGILLVLALVIPVVVYGGYGVSIGYTTLSYFIVTVFCFAFISSGTLEVGAGTVIAFVLGLALTVYLPVRVREYIKKEVALGKTVESSVKAGYKKTFMTALDVAVVVVLGGIAMLVGGAGVKTFALQLLIVGATVAFNVLLWQRVISYMLMSAHKDKYKYFRLVREDDDDE